MIGWWALVEGGHLNTDSSVSLSLVTSLVSSERSSTVLPRLDLGVGVCVCRLLWQKERVKLAFFKGKPGIGSFYSPQISRIESRTRVEPVLNVPHL